MNGLLQRKRNEEKGFPYFSKYLTLKIRGYNHAENDREKKKRSYYRDSNLSGMSLFHQFIISPR
jgi:hypothetical protein